MLFRNLATTIAQTLAGLAVLGTLLSPTGARAADASWLAGEYGVSIHFYQWFYQGYSYDEAVDRFDVNVFADQVKSSGAKWVYFGLQQNFKTLPAPSLKYEELTGRQAWEYSASSGRDLVDELAVALNAKGIKLILYWMAGGYFDKDEEARGIAAKLGWDTVTAKATPLFTANTSSILEEYSLRYKSKVSGWWLDACNGYFGFTDPAKDFTPMVNAMRAGNPNSIIALNQGVETFTRIHAGVDYTAGESREFNHLPSAAGTGKVNGLQWSMVSYLAPKHPEQDGGISGWGMPGVRHHDSLPTLINYTKTVLERKGAVTFDIHAGLDGLIDAPQYRVLLSIRQAIRKDTVLAPVGLARDGIGIARGNRPAMKTVAGSKGAYGMRFSIPSASPGASPDAQAVRDGLGRGIPSAVKAGE